MTMRFQHTSTIGEHRLLAFADPGGIDASLDAPVTRDEVRERQEQLAQRKAAVWTKWETLNQRARRLRDEAKQKNGPFNQEEIDRKWKEYNQNLTSLLDQYSRSTTSFEREEALGDLDKIITEALKYVDDQEQVLKPFLDKKKEGNDAMNQAWMAFNDDTKPATFARTGDREEACHDYVRGLAQELTVRNTYLKDDPENKERIFAIYQEVTDAHRYLYSLNRSGTNPRFDLFVDALKANRDEYGFLKKSRDSTKADRMEELLTEEADLRGTFNTSVEQITQDVLAPGAKTPEQIATYRKQLTEAQQLAAEMPDAKRTATLAAIKRALEHMTKGDQNAELTPLRKASDVDIAKMNDEPTLEQAEKTMASTLKEWQFLESHGAKKGDARFDLLTTEYLKMNKFQKQATIVRESLKAFSDGLAPKNEAIATVDAELQKVGMALKEMVALYPMHQDELRGQVMDVIEKALKDKRVQSKVTVGADGKCTWKVNEDLRKVLAGPFARLREATAQLVAAPSEKTVAALETSIVKLNKEMPSLRAAVPDPVLYMQAGVDTLNRELVKVSLELSFDGTSFHLDPLQERSEQSMESFRAACAKVDAAREELLTVMGREDLRADPDNVATVLAFARTFQSRLAEVNKLDWKGVKQHLPPQEQAQVDERIQYHQQSQDDVERLIFRLGELQRRKKPLGTLGAAYKFEEPQAVHTVNHDYFPQGYVEEVYSVTEAKADAAKAAVMASDKAPTDRDAAKTAVESVQGLVQQLTGDKTALQQILSEGLARDNATAARQRRLDDVQRRKGEATKTLERLQQRFTQLDQKRNQDSHARGLTARMAELADVRSGPEHRLQSLQILLKEYEEQVTRRTVWVMSAADRATELNAARKEIQLRRQYGNLFREVPLHELEAEQNAARIEELDNRILDLEPLALTDTQRKLHRAEFAGYRVQTDAAEKKYRLAFANRRATDEQKEQARKEYVDAMVGEQAQILLKLGKEQNPDRARLAHWRLLELDGTLSSVRSWPEQQAEALRFMQVWQTNATEAAKTLAPDAFDQLGPQERKEHISNARDVLAMAHSAMTVAGALKVIEGRGDMENAVNALITALERAKAKDTELAKTAGEQQKKEIMRLLATHGASLWDSDKYDAYPELVGRMPYVDQALAEVGKVELLNSLMKQFNVRIVVAPNKSEYALGSIKDLQGQQCISIKASQTAVEMFNTIKSSLLQLKADKEKADAEAREMPIGQYQRNGQWFNVYMDTAGQRHVQRGVCRRGYWVWENQ